MFDMGLSHLVVIGIVGILVLGPEKLPGYVRDGVRMWRTLRALATTAQVKITGELLPDVAADVRALPPRQLAAHLLLGDDQAPPARSSADRPSTSQNPAA